MLKIYKNKLHVTQDTTVRRFKTWLMKVTGKYKEQQTLKLNQGSSRKVGFNSKTKY